MKIFLSHKMSGLTEEEVYKIREEAKIKIEENLPPEVRVTITYIDNYHHDDAPENAGRLWHLGRSIQQLADADAIYFVDGHNDAKGCLIESLVALVYNIPDLNRMMKSLKKNNGN